MGCGVSSTVPCASVEVGTYERFVDDLDNDGWKDSVIVYLL